MRCRWRWCGTGLYREKPLLMGDMHPPGYDRERVEHACRLADLSDPREAVGRVGKNPWRGESGNTDLPFTWKSFLPFDGANLRF
jgi:hypothetical protein